MSDPKDDQLDDADDEFGGDTDVGFRRRGRPRLPPELKRRAHLSLSLTGDELTACILQAAATKDEKGRPLTVQAWARAVLLRATGKAP